jgi:hypothetical protein
MEASLIHFPHRTEKHLLLLTDNGIPPPSSPVFQASIQEALNKSVESIDQFKSVSNTQGRSPDSLPTGKPGRCRTYPDWIDSALGSRRFKSPVSLWGGVCSAFVHGCWSSDQQTVAGSWTQNISNTESKPQGGVLDDTAL